MDAILREYLQNVFLTHAVLETKFSRKAFYQRVVRGFLEAGTFFRYRGFLLLISYANIFRNTHNT